MPVPDSVAHTLDRRQAIARSAATMAVLAGSATLLAACAGKRRARTDLPDVNWPDSPLTDAPRSQRPRSIAPSVPGAWNGPIIPRSDWTSVPPVPALMDRAQPYYRITVHHDGMDRFAATSRGAAEARLRDILRQHKKRNFGDIGYHYLIDPAGRVWEGRSLHWQGAHVAKTNQGNLGICVMGNFELQRPTPAALATLDRFVIAQMHTYRVRPRLVHTHQELKPTLCPGRNLQRYMIASRGGGAIARA